MEQVKVKTKHLFYLILGLIVLRPSLDIFSNWQFKVYSGLPQININILLGGFVFLFSGFYLIGKYKQVISTPLFVFIKIFLGLAFFSIFYSIDSFASGQEFIRISTIFLLYFLAYQITASKRDFFLIIKAILISYLVPAIAAFIQFFFGFGLADDFGGFLRVFGTFAHPNPFAFYTFFVLSLLILIILSKELTPKKRQLWYWLAAATAIFLLLATYSRSALFTLFLFILFFGFLKYRKLLLIGLVIFTAGYLFFPWFQERFWQMISLDPYGSVVWRLRLWKDMLPVAMWHPWLGQGLGSFTQITEFYRGYKFGSLNAHNDYFKLFTELGIVGLLAYLSLALATLIHLWKVFKEAVLKYKTLALGMLIIVLSLYGVSLFDNILRATALQWNLWILLGAWLKISSFTKKEA